MKKNGVNAMSETYTATFCPGEVLDLEGEPPKPVTQSIGQPIILPGPGELKAIGAFFDRWLLSGTNVTYLAGDSVTFEENVELTAQWLTLTGGEMLGFSHFFIQDHLETNFIPAALFLSPGEGQPAHEVECNVRKFQRIVGQKVEFVEATLQEVREPNEGETWDAIVDLFMYRGNQVYWTSLPATENTLMTLTDPVLFNPPT